MSFFDTELFIVEVEKEECLWKMNSKEYMVDRYVKAKAWAKIASNMYDEWESYNKEEQELKSKFKICIYLFFIFYIHILGITYPFNDITISNYNIIIC